MLAFNVNRLIPIILLSALVALANTTAQAGCGCDHPPPEWAQIMPPFASKGKTITIHAVDATFVVGASYVVDFDGPTRTAIASVDDRLELKVPGAAAIGPVAITVTGPGYNHTYDDSYFTKMAKPRKIKNREGFFKANHYKAAIARDGTLLLALDLRSVLDPRQFMMGFLDLPLVYNADDVVIYNKDGVDLTLFTAEVADPTLRQWGSYYGWDVEGDAGLNGTYFETQTDDSEDNVFAGISNLFTYWRHEFHTYKTAHLSGGTHETNEFGLHPDATRHIDHYNLVIAIRGQERDLSDPMDPTRFQDLQPGMREVKLGWVSFNTDAPFETADIATLISDTDGPLAEMLEEVELEED